MSLLERLFRTTGEILHPNVHLRPQTNEGSATRVSPGELWVGRAETAASISGRLKVEDRVDADVVFVSSGMVRTGGTVD